MNLTIEQDLPFYKSKKKGNGDNPIPLDMLNFIKINSILVGF